MPHARGMSSDDRVSVQILYFSTVEFGYVTSLRLLQHLANAYLKYGGIASKLLQ